MEDLATSQLMNARIMYFPLIGVSLGVELEANVVPKGGSGDPGVGGLEPPTTSTITELCHVSVHLPASCVL
jgi:hypothetical protein